MGALKNWDLWAACGWAGLTVAAVTVTDWTALRLFLSIPLISLVMGHTVLRALGMSTGALAQHLTYATGTGVSACILGGFVLHFTGGLNPTGWAVWICGVVTLTALVAAVRATPAFPIRCGLIPGFRLRHGITLGGSLAMAAMAYAVAVWQEKDNHEFRYTEFWMVRQGSSGQLAIGVRSAESRGQVFDLEVTLDGLPFASYRGLAMQPGQTWARGMFIPVKDTAQTAVARLYRVQDNAVYRRVSAYVPGA